ncbi:Glycoside hydrolase superfamily [Cinara cedri]|uniref:Glycoside hydrolase superfamily n=1 Tax=Cinara cedri TaxID=506608 RepID=A0A5E4N8G4_9HEMI|nr:Glycoside hydrolase superfamily [Cinara cedri]
MMDLKFVNIKLCLKLFIILKLFIQESNSASVTLANLNTICCIDTGTNEITNINDALPYCTAIATFSGNDQTTQNDITILRGNLPYVYIYDNQGHSKMKKSIKPKHVSKFVNELVSLINDDKIDVMIFDHFAPESYWSRKNKDSFQDHLVDFFTKLKSNFPDKLFGLFLPKEEKYLKKGFDVSVIDNVVDVYLVKSIGYKKCKKRFPIRHTHQEDMRTVDPSNNLDFTLKMLMTLGYDLKKCLLDIRVIVNTVNWWHSNTKNDISYSNLCSHDPSSKRSKYCSEILNGFYEKGQLISKYKMAGAFIQSIDRDDHNCSCTCGLFPATQCISAGLKGLVAPSLVKCIAWGLPPKDRGNIPSDDDSSVDDDSTTSDSGPPPDLTPAAGQPGGDPADSSE